METLDIGSGPHPKGTVNIDLNPKFKPTVVAEGRSLPFKSSVFDEVVLSHILEHVIDPEKILKEVHRVLKADKPLEIVFPNFASLSVFLAWFTQFSFGPRRIQNFPYIISPRLQRSYNIIYGSHTIGEYDVHHVPLTLRLMRALLEEAGFYIRTVKGEGFLLPFRRISFIRELSIALAKFFPVYADVIRVVALKEKR